MKKALILTGCLLLTLLTGAISGYFTIQGVATWYITLHKPSFNPPSSIFGPVWSFLYLLMGVSLYLVIIQPRSDARAKAINIFIAQLILNFLWSFIFFNLHLIGLALAEILVMWLMIFLMIRSFYRLRKMAAFLQFPYIAWVSFASLLNAAIFYLN